MPHSWASIGERWRGGLRLPVWDQMPSARASRRGLEADGEFCWQDGAGTQWWRIWVDIGGCAPEALPFIVRPPKAYGKQVRDVVPTSDLHRLDLLAAQIEHNWSGKLFLFVRGSRPIQIKELGHQKADALRAVCKSHVSVL